MESETSVATTGPPDSFVPGDDHWECGACIAIAVLAGYAWGRWDALKPFRKAAWNGLTEPIRHMGLVTVTCLQFRTLIAKAQKFDQMYDLWVKNNRRAG